MLRIDDIRAALARQPPAADDEFGPIQTGRNDAAVALLLTGRSRDLSLCLIRRAEKPGDPWSGHVAFPGGRRASDDTDPWATAERETEEEIGLRLRPEQRLGRLAPLTIRLSGRETRLRLFAAVYSMGVPVPAFRCNREVAAAWWIPLAHLWDANHATYLRLSTDSVMLSYPAIRLPNGALLWGISLRVLALFSDVTGQPLPHLEEIPGIHGKQQDSFHNRRDGLDEKM